MPDEAWERLREAYCRGVWKDPRGIPGTEAENLGGKLWAVACETSAYDAWLGIDTRRPGSLDDGCDKLKARGCGGLVAEEAFEGPSSKEDLGLEIIGEGTSRSPLALTPLKQ